MLKNKLKPKTTYFCCICLALLLIIFLAPQIQATTKNQLSADTGIYIDITCTENDTSYTITANPSTEITYNYEIIFYVNDYSFLEPESLTIEKDGTTTFQVYCVLKQVVAENETQTYEDIYSQTLTLTPISAEDDNLISPTLQMVLKTILPIIVIVAFFSLITFHVNKKKYTPFGRLVKDLKEMQQQTKTMVGIFKNEKILPKQKNRKYRKYLKQQEKISSNCISRVIPLNIESMGQYNALLSNLFNLNNIIQAGIKTLPKTKQKQKERLVDELHRNLLPKAVINAEETKSAWERQLANTEKQFVQHSSYRKTLSSEKDYQQLLKRTVFYRNGADNDGDNDDGDGGDD